MTSISSGLNEAGPLKKFMKRLIGLAADSPILLMSNAKSLVFSLFFCLCASRASFKRNSNRSACSAWETLLNVLMLRATRGIKCCSSLLLNEVISLCRLSVSLDAFAMLILRSSNVLPSVLWIFSSTGSKVMGGKCSIEVLSNFSIFSTIGIWEMVSDRRVMKVVRLCENTFRRSPEVNNPVRHT